MTADDGDALERAYAAIVAEARAHVAGGGAANLDGLRQRIRGATRAFRSREPGRAQELERAQSRALAELDRIAAVQRARARLASEPARPEPAPAPAPPRRRPPLRTRPTITGNMDVRRPRPGLLEWDGAPGITDWEVRISERSGGARDYAVRETRALAGAETSLELALGQTPLRVHLLGRGRGGRLLRRAILSGLSEESWGERWERRASAS